MQNKINLFQGDCLSVMDELIGKGVIADTIIADPPYGTTLCKWDNVIPFDEMWERLNKLVKPNGAVVLFGSEPFSSALRMSNINNYKYDLIWDKCRSGAVGVAKYRPMPSFENILIFYKKPPTYNPQMRKGKPYIDSRKTIDYQDVNQNHNINFTKRVPQDNKGTRYPLSIISETNFNFKGKHPTQKPLPLMKYLVETYSNEDDLVLDFTMGSGTTMVACRHLDRRGIGIEIDEKYFTIAKDRVEDKGSLFGI